MTTSCYPSDFWSLAGRAAGTETSTNVCASPSQSAGVRVNALYRAAERRQPKRAGHLGTGARGERAAFFWLRRRGYTVVARNWRSSRARGDLDLIAWDGDELCFIEVKTRTTRAVAPAEAAVDLDKRRNLRRLGRHYLRQLPRRGVPTRFDVLSIYFESGKPPGFEYFPGVFGWVKAQR